MYVDTQQDLKRLSKALSGADRIGVDTEFMRERTYYPRLCLIQVSTPEINAVVDPIALTDIRPLERVLASPKVLKVVHSGEQDLAIFYERIGRVPSPVFDTQIAATMAGFASQVAYGSLVETILDVKLRKAERYTDWAARPLKDAQIEYALEDVRYLLPLHEALLQRLRRDGREEWLKPELDRLVNPDRYAVKPEEQYRRIKRHTSLSRRGLGVLRQVAAWRELEAQKRDLPRRWVISDESLVEIARRAPATVDEVMAVRGVQGKLSVTAAKSLLTMIRKGVATPDEDLPSVPPRQRTTSDVESAIDLMYALVRTRAKARGVAVSTLATRADLEALAMGKRKGSSLLEGWRGVMVGQDLVDLLDGKIMLGLDTGSLTVKHC